MKKRRLGRTGMLVSQLGFGGIPIERVSFEEAIEVVKHAVDRGINFIDTARRYSDSERKIGMALKEIDAEVYLASKSPARSAGGVLQDLETSLEELDVRKIDLYQLHHVSTAADFEEIMKPGGALEGLQQAREEGLIDFIGITGHRVEILVEAMQTGKFDTVQTCYNFIEIDPEEELIPLAEELDIGVIGMKPFAGGIIEDAELALKYVLSQPAVVPIPGVELTGYLDENIKIASGDLKLSTEERARIAKIRGNTGDSFCHRCGYCLPCPNEVPIPSILGIEALMRKMGEEIVVNGRFGNLLARAQQCVQCDLCKPRCPYELDIPEIITTKIAYIKEKLEESK